MEKKMISVNVETIDFNGEKVSYLSIDNCAPQQLNSILSLCKAGMTVVIHFVEVDMPHGMRPQTND